MRHGPHSHPCSHCGAPTDCGGELERNFDGAPETTCRAYHDPNTGGIADVLCEACAEADAEQAAVDEADICW